MSEEHSRQPEDPLSSVMNRLSTAISERQPAPNGLQYGYYYLDTNNQIVHQPRPAPPHGAPLADIDHNLEPDQGRAERVEYRSKGDMKTNKVVIFDGTGLHPDEREAGTIAFNLFQNKDFRRTEVYTAHPLAAYFDSRHYVVPFTPENDQSWNPRGPDNHTTMQNMVENKDKANISGIRVDLNRQFMIPETATSYDQLYRSNLYPEAKLALKMVEDSAGAQALFTYHEDIDADGPYYYDCAPDARTDTDRALVNQLHKDYVAKLRSTGFEPFNGIDDVDDPMLRLEVINGQVYQPVIKEDGSRTVDTSFENAAVALSLQKGPDGRPLSNIQRSFCLEIPQNLSSERKQLLVEIFNNTIMIPYLKAKGLYEEMT